MASNKKWFKRAIRSLTVGDTRLWHAIKKRFPDDQVKRLEEEFLGTTPQKAPLTEEVVTEATPEEDPPKKRRAPKTESTKKAPRKKATKTRNKKEAQDG